MFTAGDRARLDVSRVAGDVSDAGAEIWLDKNAPLIIDTYNEH
jgi:hypothetical protein